MIHNGTWRQTNASRYIRKFQSRRSLLVWKIYGERRDGWSNDDFPTADTPGDPDTLKLAGKPVPNSQPNRDRSDLDFRGSPMPPPAAVTARKVKPLTDEDRRTIVRWIDLGCPIDFGYDPTNPDHRGFGWAGDDKRPTVTLTEPTLGTHAKVSRLLIGITDYYSGVEIDTFKVTTDFTVNGTSAGADLASQFQQIGDGIYELKLDQPVTSPGERSVSVSVEDRQGNTTRIDRTFSVE